MTKPIDYAGVEDAGTEPGIEARQMQSLQI